MFGVDDLLLGTLIGGIGSGIISTAGQIYTNNKNIAMQKSTNDTNWQIASLNNATQIDMANTAHQREVADLKAAGLNPILSAGGSGAATPSLASSRMDSAQIENPVNGIANSAKSLGNFVSGMSKAELEQAKETARQTKYDALTSKAESDVAQVQGDLDYLNNKLELQALRELTSEHVKDAKGVWHEVYNPDNKLVKERKRGIVSDAKIRARQSARNLYSDVLSGVNSAGKVFDAFVGAKRLGKSREINKQLEKLLKKKGYK